MSKKVDINFVMKLQKIFSQKKWLEVENHDHAFESFCNLSELFEGDEDQYNLFLELIESYNWMSFADYSTNINHLLRKVFSHVGITINKFYTFPIIISEDQEKNKSGNSVSYIMKCNQPYVATCRHATLVELTQFKQFEDLSLKEDEYILLVDDYIGSGETLNICINTILEKKPEFEKNILIATIAIQHDTIPKITYPLFYNLEVKRGISDNYVSPVKERNIDIMLNLEKKLISGRGFSLGYEQSEGLITMLRTPDNTFPIFWHEYKKSMDLYPPFPRI